MSKTNKLTSLFFQIIGIFLISTSIIATAQAKSKQQLVFLDSNGNPIPNDILLTLSSSKRMNSAKKKSTTNIIPSPSKSIIPNKTNKKRSRSTPELEKELLDALLVGKSARASQLIRAGVKVNYKNYKGETPLTVAVDRGWASMVVDLIEHGGRFRKRNSQGLSLLHHASSKGYTDLSKVLIKHGLNPSSTTRKDWNSLHIAARYGRWQLVQYYLQMGVDPNARTSDGKTALEIAQIVRHQGIIKILSQVTSARPVGRAANYNRRENRAHYKALADQKQKLLWEKRMKLKERLK